MLFKSLRSKSFSRGTNNSSMDARSHATHYTQGDAMDTKGPTTTIISSPDSQSSCSRLARLFSSYLVKPLPQENGDTSPRETFILRLPDSGRTTGSDDYQKFIEKSRKEAERDEKRKLKELKEAERRRKEVNMSPWASRM